MKNKPVKINLNNQLKENSKAGQRITFLINVLFFFLFTAKIVFKSLS